MEQSYLLTLLHEDISTSKRLCLSQGNKFVESCSFLFVFVKEVFFNNLISILIMFLKSELISENLNLVKVILSLDPMNDRKGVMLLLINRL